jgi:hypothetical protein
MIHLQARACCHGRIGPRVVALPSVLLFHHARQIHSPIHPSTDRYRRRPGRPAGDVLVLPSYVTLLQRPESWEREGRVAEDGRSRTETRFWRHTHMHVERPAPSSTSSDPVHQSRLKRTQQLPSYLACIAGGRNGSRTLQSKQSCPSGPVEAYMLLLLAA